MQNKGKQLKRLTVVSIILFVVVGGVAALLLWVLPGEVTAAAQSEREKEEHKAEEHPSEPHSEGDAQNHKDDDRNLEPPLDEEPHQVTDDEHAGHLSADTGHEEHAAEADVVRISDDVLKEFGIELATAQSGFLSEYIELPGEIVLNADRMAHVVPRVPGIVRDVRKAVGDSVEEGEVMAVMESRELAKAKAEYFAARERLALAKANFDREKGLWQEKISAEQEYLDARRALAEAGIEANSAEQQLHALGFSESELEKLSGDLDAVYTRYEVNAPITGTVIAKHMTLGENLDSESDVFTIADLSSVWVNIKVYQKDLVNIHAGQPVGFEVGHGIPDASGTIAWVGPQVDETTRTATARVELPNPDGSLRPGLFVTAKVTVGSAAADLVIPKSALQTFENRTVVFVRTAKGYEPKPVELGRQNGSAVEILSGLMAGDVYVSQGAFTLKAQLSKSAFGDGHNH